MRSTHTLNCTVNHELLMDENQNTSPENYCHVCESLLWNIKGDQHGTSKSLPNQIRESQQKRRNFCEFRV